MHKKITFFIFFLICYITIAFAQQPDRTEVIQNRLAELSATVPGLKEKVQLSVTGVSVQEFLRALASSNKLNINIDPKLNFQVYNNFTNETALNILVFLSK